MRRGLKEILLEEFHQEMMEHKAEVKRTIFKAMSTLKDLEKNLPKTSESQYYTSTYVLHLVYCIHSHSHYTDEKSMLKSEFQKWHMKEMRREEALKEVEDEVRQPTQYSFLSLKNYREGY